MSSCRHDPATTKCISSRSLNLNRFWPLAAQVAIVSQEPVLFADTIRANITYGCKGQVPDAAVEAAAAVANALGFISALPQGFDTMVGERGVRLSGGQKQRVAIARAVVLNPRLLLLDEATSALDAESEHLVQEALDRVSVGRTAVVIAHRLSTVASADEVVVVEGGAIAERGTHAALLASGGAYAALVHRQLLGAAPRDPGAGAASEVGGGADGMAGGDAASVVEAAEASTSEGSTP